MFIKLSFLKGVKMKGCDCSEKVQCIKNEECIYISEDWSGYYVSLWMKYEYLKKKEEVQQHEKTELKKVSLVLFEGSVKNKNKREWWVIKWINEAALKTRRRDWDECTFKKKKSIIEDKDQQSKEASEDLCSIKTKTKWRK